MLTICDTAQCNKSARESEAPSAQTTAHWSPTGHPLVTNWSPTGFQCGAPNAFGAYKGAASQHQYECPTNIVRLIHNQLLTRFIPPGV